MARRRPQRSHSQHPKNWFKHFVVHYIANILNSPVSTSIGILAAIVILMDAHQWINHTTALEILSVIIGAGFSMIKDN